LAATLITVAMLAQRPVLMIVTGDWMKRIVSKIA
jgi:hypothetical protein